MDTPTLINRFLHHEPHTAAIAGAHHQVRYIMGSVAEWLNHLVPDGNDKTRAIDALDDAMKHANAAIARGHQVDEGIVEMVPTFPSTSEYNAGAHNTFGQTILQTNNNQTEPGRTSTHANHEA